MSLFFPIFFKRLFTRVTDVTTSSGDNDEENNPDVFQNVWQPDFHHEEDMIENAIAKHDFEFTDGGPSQSRNNWPPENNYFASSTDRPVYSSYSDYKQRREPYRANTPKARFSPSLPPKNYNTNKERINRVRGPQNFVQSPNLYQYPGSASVPIQNHPSYGSYHGPDEVFKTSPKFQDTNPNYGSNQPRGSGPFSNHGLYESSYHHSKDFKTPKFQNNLNYGSSYSYHPGSAPVLNKNPSYGVLQEDRRHMLPGKRFTYSNEPM